jgi:hypothetical protein
MILIKILVFKNYNYCITTLPDRRCPVLIMNIEFAVPARKFSGPGVEF